MGFTLGELDQMDEGFVLGMIIESSNDQHPEEYMEVADQKFFDRF